MKCEYEWASSNNPNQLHFEKRKHFKTITTAHRRYEEKKPFCDCVNNELVNKTNFTRQT